MATKSKKATKARRSIAKVAKGAAVKRSAKPAKAKAKAKAVREYQPKPGTGTVFDGDTKLIVLVKANPKRDGSAAHKRFQAYITGKRPATVAAAIAKGLTLGDIRWDAGQGYIRLGNVKVENARD